MLSSLWFEIFIIFKLELAFSEQLFLWVYNGMKSQIGYGYSGVVGITVYIKTFELPSHLHPLQSGVGRETP